MVNLVRDGEPLRHEQARRRQSSPWRTSSTRSVWMPRATPWHAPAPTRASTSTSTCSLGRTNDNPVYYVQYAHARISSLLRNAADLGITVDARRFRPVAALPRARGRPARCPRRVPAGRGQRRRAAGAAPGGALPRGAGHRVPQVLRRRAASCHAATRSRRRRTGRDSCCARPRVRCWPTDSCSWGSPHPNGCEPRARCCPWLIVVRGQR